MVFFNFINLVITETRHFNHSIFNIYSYTQNIYRSIFINYLGKCLGIRDESIILIMCKNVSGPKERMYT